MILSGRAGGGYPANRNGGQPRTDDSVTRPRAAVSPHCNNRVVRQTRPHQRSGITSSIIAVVLSACCATWSMLMPITDSG